MAKIISFIVSFIVLFCLVIFSALLTSKFGLKETTILGGIFGLIVFQIMVSIGQGKNMDENQFKYALMDIEDRLKSIDQQRTEIIDLLREITYRGRGER